MLSDRLDAFVNWISGIGSSRDRTKGGYFEREQPLPDEILTAMFNGDDLAERVASLLPNECQREGYTIGNPDLAKEAGRLALSQHLYDAHLWGRLYGGALLFAVCGDSAPAHTPRPSDARVLDLQVWDRRRCLIQEYNQNQNSPLFGKPEIYSIQPFVGFTAQAPIVVHSSRVVRFHGAKTDDLSILSMAGWDYSVLQRVFPILQQFAEADGATGLMLSEASQAVFKLKGLLDGLAAKQSSDLQKRLAFLDMNRSNARAVMLDADPKYGESFDRFNVQFSGVADLIRTKMQRLAAAAGVPMGLLFSQAPTGLNASDDNEMRGFYDRTRAYQESYLEPKLREVLGMIAPGGEQAPILWAPLWQETPGEAAKTHLAQAQADQINITEGVCTAEEVALSRFKASGYSTETRIDPKLRRVAPAPAAPTVPALPPKPAP